MITIEPASTITFLDLLNYAWIPNHNEKSAEFFNGFGYNPNDAQDYKVIQESNPNYVWTLLKDGDTEEDYHFYSGFFPLTDDVKGYILTQKPASSLNIKVALPV